MKVSLNIIDNVAKILKSSIESQKDDGWLVANYWYCELVNLGYREDEAKRFTSLIAEGKLTHFESIRRCRQKLQSEDPKTYGKNRRHREKEIQTELYAK